MYVCMPMCRSVCAHMGGQRTASGVIPKSTTHLLADRVTPQPGAYESVWADWLLAREPPQPASTPAPSDEIIGACHHFWFVKWVLESHSAFHWLHHLPDSGLSCFVSVP